MNRILLCISVLLAAACSRIDLQDELAKQNSNAWLTSVPDATLLTRLSIPGAHDAASCTIKTLSLFTRTQELNIAELWACGVRAFDLRPAWKDGTLGIYHDRYDAEVSFQHIVNTLIIALRQDPGEFAIILVRHEQEADDNDPDWPSAMGSYLGSASEMLVSYNPGLTVGDLRGKILLLSRNEYEGGPHGGYIRGWNSGTDISAQQGASVQSADGNTYPLWVQDFYDPSKAEQKWDEVRDMLDATAAATAPYPLVINHASGYLGGSIPDYRGNARSINASLVDYLSSSTAPAGIVMMDFAGASQSRGVQISGDALVQALIKQNRK